MLAHLLLVQKGIEVQKYYSLHIPGKNNSSLDSSPRSTSYVPRSGSTLTGHLLTQGRRAPNYVFEPMAYFNGKDLPQHEIAPEFRAELMSVFETGRPKKSHNSFFHSNWFQYILSVQQDWGPWVKRSLTHLAKASGYFRFCCILLSFIITRIY